MPCLRPVKSGNHLDPLIQIQSMPCFWGQLNQSTFWIHWIQINTIITGALIVLVRYKSSKCSFNSRGPKSNVSALHDFPDSLVQNEHDYTCLKYYSQPAPDPCRPNEHHWLISRWPNLSLFVVTQVPLSPLHGLSGRVIRGYQTSQELVTAHCLLIFISQ